MLSVSTVPHVTPFSRSSFVPCDAPHRFSHPKMFQRKSSKDVAALSLLLPVPVTLLLLALYALFVRNADSLYKPRHPDYVSPAARSSKSLSICLAPMTSRLGQGLPTTKMYMPLVGGVDYITAHASRGDRHRTTTWGLFIKTIAQKRIMEKQHCQNLV